MRLKGALRKASPIIGCLTPMRIPIVTARNRQIAPRELLSPLRCKRSGNAAGPHQKAKPEERRIDGHHGNAGNPTTKDDQARGLANPPHHDREQCGKGDVLPELPSEGAEGAVGSPVREENVLEVCKRSEQAVLLN